MERRTTKPEYVGPLLDVLGRLGAASEEQLLNETFQYMREELYPLDHAIFPNGEPRWKNQMQHMLDGLIEDGKINKKDGLLSLGELQT